VEHDIVAGGRPSFFRTGSVALVAGLCLSLGFVGPGFAQSAAVFRGLDKVTGHTKDVPAAIGRSVRFGTLEIVARDCWKAAPEDAPEVKIYVEIWDTPVPRNANEKPERKKLKEGWVFASSPSLNALDHPLYDVWAIDCKS
jgi:hypothetical protein